VLVLFAVFPGAVYDYALFPTSLALALVVGSVLAAIGHRPVLGATLMALAGLCYPSAWFAAVGLAVAMVVRAYGTGRLALVPGALWGVAGLGSIVVLGAYDQLSTGRIDAYFVIQHSAVSGGQAFPGQGLLAIVFDRHTTPQRQLGPLGGDMLAVQALGALALAGGAAVVALRRRPGRRATAALYPAAVGVGVVLALVLTNNPGAWNRSVVLAAPCVVCLRRVPTPVLAVVVVLVGATTALISRSFFLFNGP
jgi:hypothetical protein